MAGTPEKPITEICHVVSALNSKLYKNKKASLKAAFLFDFIYSNIGTFYYKMSLDSAGGKFDRILHLDSAMYCCWVYKPQLSFYLIVPNIHILLFILIIENSCTFSRVHSNSVIVYIIKI